MGFLSIMSALPMADIACKGVMKILEGVAAKQLTKLLGKALRKFDAKAAAKIWLKLEKKFPSIGPWLKTIVEGIQFISQKIAKVAEVISKHWLKFRIVQILFQNKIVGFFKNLFNIKEKIKQWMDKIPEEKVYEKITENAIAIKDLIQDKKIGQLKVSNNIAPKILQSALLVGQNPKSKGFKGIPTQFLSNLPNVAGSMKTTQQLEKPKMKSFDEFEEKPKIEKKPSLEEKPKTKEPTKVAKPKEPISKPKEKELVNK